MKLSIEKLIQEKWKNEQSPIIDGILYDNGDLVMMDYEYFDNDNQLELKIDHKASLSELLDEDPDMWTSLIELFSVTLQKEGIRICCGEGGYGSDGFVAACDIDNNYLRWLAFFQQSNPFDSIKLSGNNVIVHSTYKQLWTFPILKPENVVVSGKRWGVP